MRIQNIQNYPSSQICCAKKMGSFQKVAGSVPQSKTPLADGLSTFGAWFGFGSVWI